MRRKYVKAEPFAPTCAEVIDLIGKLYEIERDLPNPHALEGADREAALTHIRAIRQERSAPIVAQIKAWATRQQALPESTFRKAIQYMLDLWHGLTVFLENPWVVLDNSFVERQIRPLVNSVSLCTSSSSAWNLEGEAIAGISTRATATLAMA